MPETKRRKGESVEDLKARISEMEAELRDGHGRPLTWDEVTSTTAEEIAAKETRRGILPRLIHAAKVKRLEVDLRDRGAEAEAIRAKLEPAYEAFQEMEAEARAAKERAEEAGGEWRKILSAVNSADGRAERTARELAELKGEA
jgi:chromosome segregation ATPase